MVWGILNTLNAHLGYVRVFVFGENQTFQVIKLFHVYRGIE